MVVFYSALSAGSRGERNAAQVANMEAAIPEIKTAINSTTNETPGS